MKADWIKTYLRAAKAIYTRPTYIGVLFLGGFAGRLLFLLNTYVVGRWADRLALGVSRQGDAYRDLTLLLILSLAGFVLTAAFRHLYCKSTIQGVSEWHDRIVDRVTKFPTTFFERKQSGSVLNIFSTDYSATLFLSGGPLSEMMLVLFDIVAIVLLMAYNSIFSIPIMLCFLVGNYWVWRQERDRLRHLRHESSQLRARNLTFLLEASTGARIVRNFGKNHEFSEYFFSLSRALHTSMAQTSARQSQFALKVNMVSAVVLLMVALGSAQLIASGAVTVGEAGVALSLIFYAGITVDYFFTYLANFGDAAAAIERLAVYAFDLPTIPEQSATSAESKGREPLGIQYQDVWLSYDNNQLYALKGVSFTVQPGERLGIIGRTGSGKSSIVQTIFGLYPIDKGSITFFQSDGPLVSFGQQLPGANFGAKHIGYLSQDFFLFKGTVRANIDIDEKISDAELIQALNRVGLSRFASREGLNHIINERGTNVSQGEKQLLAMARFFVEAKSIVIFDEPTSAVDPETERIARQAIEQHFQGKTQIIVSHKLSILQKCDRIIWLDQGRVRTEGSPQAVIDRFLLETTNSGENFT